MQPNRNTAHPIPMQPLRPGVVGRHEGTEKTRTRALGGASSVATVPVAPRFYSVQQAARLIGTSPVTLYRAIRAGEFPAVRIRGRLIIPAQAIEALVQAALTNQSAAEGPGWVVRR